EKVRSVQNLNDEIFELRGKVQEWERELWVYRAEILHYCLKRDFAQGYVLFRKLFEPALRNNKVKYARMLLDTMQVETSAMRGWQYGLPLIEKVVVNTPQERELTRSELESEWLVKQARILNREGNYEQARALCSQVLEEPVLNIWLELEAASTLARISEATQRIALYERSVELAHQVADIHPNFERLMLTQLGESYSRQGQWDKALEYYKQALEIAQQLKNQPAVAWILNSISDIYRHNGDVDEAYVYCLRGLHIRREQQSEREIAASSLTLGDIYRDANQPVKALRTYEQAEAIYQRLVDAQGLGTDQLTLARILQEQGYVYWRLLSDEEKANVFFSRAREIYERFGNEYGLTYSYALFGRTSRTNGVKADKMGNLDEAVKLYKESEAHYLKALNLAEKVQDWYQVAEISTSLAVVYHLLGDLEKIEQYQQQVEDIAKRYNYNFLLSRLYEHLGHTACSQKTWQTAAQYYAMACHYMAKYTRAWYQRTVHSVFGRIMTLPSTEAVNVSENILEYWQVTENLREEVPEIIALAQAVIDVFHITPT
ncbi:MAG: tetratricopeptide repeat protein, partial [Anaerolineae bacterium]|nr:tetratricopeptide repeat protein [Anaerolineae bacterium]